MAADADCDGVLTAADCDDNDTNLGAIANDADCDGVLTAADCNDNEPGLGAMAADADCDGVLTADDCDDNDSNLGAIASDADCDGILTADDCDDTAPDIGPIANDTDCDLVPNLLDCNSSDADILNDPMDVDCDGNADYVIFRKDDYADPTEPINQDCITPEVCISRGDQEGIYNVAQESGYNYDYSPTGVQFAAGYAGQDLTFTNWRSSIPRTSWWVLSPMVMQVEDGATYNLVPFSWTSRGYGGGFAWARAQVHHFSKADFADPADQANQDCVVPGVCLTRGDTKSLYNAALESGYGAASPAGTEWAPMATKDASPEDYTSFTTAVNSDPQSMIGQVMSLHVEGTSIYFDLVITEWSGGGPGGGFAWSRSRALVVGCTDPEAENYDPRATADDGWCGDWVRFEVPSYPDASDPKNHDCITNEVCITRGENMGLYNSVYESQHNNDISPVGTLWAPYSTSQLTEMPEYLYTNWRDAVSSNPNQAVYVTYSLYIPAERRYFDVVMLRWPSNSSGGGFTYVRREVEIIGECSDGIRQPGEQCDDNNNRDADGCQSNCILPICGDGIVDPDEECDEGADNSDEPNSCKTNCVSAKCGDGFIDEGEECDDGNGSEGDGCNNDCTLDCGHNTGAIRGLVRASDGACLMLFPARVPYANASSTCNMVGGNLVTVNNAAENLALANWLNENETIWLGLNDIAEEGAWRWVSGSTYTSAFWASYEPNNSGGNEDCAEMHSNGYWNDVDCNTVQFPACETTCGNGTIEPGEACDDGTNNSNASGSACRMNCETAAWCGDGIRDLGEQCDDGNYIDGDGCDSDCSLPCGIGMGAAAATLSPTDGACYLFYSDAMSWNAAEEYCQTRGGHLATISDAAENGALYNIAYHNGGSIWIGFSDETEEGSYYWTDGSPVTYTNWNTWEPNGWESENCSQLLNTGRWNDLRCDTRTPFVCEVQP